MLSKDQVQALSALAGGIIPADETDDGMASADALLRLALRVEQGGSAASLGGGTVVLGWVPAVSVGLAEATQVWHHDVMVARQLFGDRSHVGPVSRPSMQQQHRRGARRSVPIVSEAETVDGIRQGHARFLPRGREDVTERR